MNSSSAESTLSRTSPPIAAGTLRTAPAWSRRRALHSLPLRTENIVGGDGQKQRLCHVAMLNCPVPVLVTSIDGTIAAVNPACCRETGYTEAELVGQDVQILRSPRSSAATYRELWDTITAGKTWRGELCNSRKDGTRYWASVSIAPVCNDHGVVTHYVSFQENVTVQKEQERRLHGTVSQLKNTVRKLRDLEELRDSLVNMIVHDIRVPLAAAKWDLELLERVANEAPDGRVTALAGRISTAVEEVMSMAEMLLVMRRVENGSINLEISRHGVPNLVGQALQCVLPECRDRIRIQNLPQLDIACDAKLVGRVIWNLVDNAVKYSPSGSEIAVAAARQNSYLRLSVHDRGPGIKLSQQRRIFEKFYQHQPKSHENMHSVGLGLAFCKLAVEAHGGRIGVESAEGAGSCFWFTLPLNGQGVAAA